MFFVNDEVIHKIGQKMSLLWGVIFCLLSIISLCSGLIPGEENEAHTNKKHRRLNPRKHHIVQKGPISDDGAGAPPEEERGPHHYRHYRCSSCVKDKNKRDIEKEMEHANEVLEKFESQTITGLNAATFNAIQASDTVFDSSKGLIVDPFANATVAVTNSTLHLRTRT